MYDPNTDSLSTESISFIVKHLSVESSHLDTVIESSLEMQAILRESRNSRVPGNTLETTNDDKPSNENNSPDAETQSANNLLQTERNRRLQDRLTKLRQEITQQAMPVLEGRRELVEILNAIQPSAEKTPSLSELSTKVEEPLRKELKQLRNEIRGKLNQVQSISMGNQAVLLYTLDFYNRLLTGLSTDGERSSYYDSTGQSQNRLAGGFVQTDC